MYEDEVQAILINISIVHVGLPVVKLGYLKTIKFHFLISTFLSSQQTLYSFNYLFM
jgi:hypothetical protein